MTQLLGIVMLLTLECVSIQSIQNRIALDRHEHFEKVNVNVSWSINIEAQRIYVEIITPIGYDSNSWIAFGISDTGGIYISSNSVYYNWRCISLFSF